MGRYIILLGALFLGLPLQGKSQEAAMPARLKKFIQSIKASELGGQKPLISYSQSAKGMVRVQVQYVLDKPVQQDDLVITIRPAFKPTFHWTPHLTPGPHHVIAQHVFRAPALVGTHSTKSISIIPDLDILQKGSVVPWYMDVNVPANLFMLGMSATRVTDHVLFEKQPGAMFPKGVITLAFFCLISDQVQDIQNPWRSSLEFMWKKWALPLYQSGEPLHQKNMEPYVQQTYDWAFKNWRKPVWQEFNVSGQQVGAPVFIVNVTQSPNYPGLENQREFCSIWNQAWFNSLRSAQGLFRYAQRFQNPALKAAAIKTKELALAFPQINGFFHSVIATEMEQVSVQGQSYNRSLGWDTRYFANSNRNPYTGDPRQSPFHIADMSFTAYWMLIWYAELEKDPRLLQYAICYADALVGLQRKDGFFPAWLDLQTLEPLQHLNQSPETSISVTFLMKLYQLTQNKKYLQTATKAMASVMNKIIPVGQWEDFETYWSCSRVGSQDWVGKKVPRNNMFKQNSFSIFWTAEALLEMYLQTRHKKYLIQGQRCLDELLMFQAVWQPPFIPIRTLGGFGVMNADGEWNDSRQSLFAELIIQYGTLLKKPEYVQRGLAALRASFTMMYIPFNPQTMQQWQAKWPFFGPADYGFMMENYGHNGEANHQGLGIGEFTIYDWGNGAAAEAFNRIYDHYGDSLLKDNY